MDTKKEKANIPVTKKPLLTIEEASVFSGVEIQVLRELSAYYDCDFVLWAGRKRLFKKDKLREFLEHEPYIKSNFTKSSFKQKDGNAEV